MDVLNPAEANQYLGQIGLRVGQWSSIRESADNLPKGDPWFSHLAPSGAKELYCFAQHVYGWLPSGDWKIFQIDESTWLAPDDEFLFWRLLCGSDQRQIDPAARTFLFSYDGSADVRRENDLIISNLIHLFLLSESHAYVVSSGAKLSERLGILDGAAYFISKNAGIASAKRMIETYEENPTTSPQWLLDIQDV